MCRACTDIVEWISAHQEEYASYNGQRVAIHLEKGVVASGPDYETVYEKVKQLGLLGQVIIDVVCMGCHVTGCHIPSARSETEGEGKPMPDRRKIVSICPAPPDLYSFYLGSFRGSTINESDPGVVAAKVMLMALCNDGEVGTVTIARGDGTEWRLDSDSPVFLGLARIPEGYEDWSRLDAEALPRHILEAAQRRGKK